MTHHALRPADLVMVLIVRDDGRASAVPTATLAELSKIAVRLTRLGVPAVKLFASGRRDRRGSGGARPDSLMARAIYQIKATEPDLEVVTETCLCSYTATGDCHLTDDAGAPDISGTVEALAEQSLAQANAGADLVGPAAMVKGAVSAISAALDGTGHQRVGIMPHVIIRSGLYEEYRRTMEAAPASGERPFQIPLERPDEAITRTLGFIAEGASHILLEPALMTSDILVTLAAMTDTPVLPFSVSGEYNTLSLSLQIELFSALRRAGAARIITYAAMELAQILAGSPGTTTNRNALSP